MAKTPDLTVSRNIKISKTKKQSPHISMGAFKSILQKKLRTGKTRDKKSKASGEDELRECTELKLNLNQAKDSGKWYHR